MEPHASFRVIEGEGGVPWDSDVDGAVIIVSHFLQTLAPVTRGTPLPQGIRVPLTPRQIEVLCLVAAGMGNQAIADELAISRYAVIRHLNNIFNKIGPLTGLKPRRRRSDPDWWSCTSPSA